MANTTTSGGSLNKHNAHQQQKNKAYYANQPARTAANKQRHIDAQKRFEAKCAEKRAARAARIADIG